MHVYGVALASRIDKMIVLFCKRALSKRQHSAKETYDFIDPTNRSHPICIEPVVDNCLCACTCGRVFAVCMCMYRDSLVERNPPNRGGLNPPPPGGFLFTMFPRQEPCVRGPPSKNLIQILRGGSSYTQFLMREHSKGGGGFFR